MENEVNVIIDALRKDCKDDLKALERYARDIRTFLNLESRGGGPRTEPLDEQGNSALHIAARNGHLNVVVVLLGLGFKPMRKNNFGNTPLHEAARHGHGKVCRALLDVGAKADVANDLGLSATDYWNQQVGANNGGKGE